MVVEDCSNQLPAGVVCRVDGTSPISAIGGAPARLGCDMRRAARIAAGAETPTTVTFSCDQCRQRGTVTGKGQPKQKRG